MVGFVYGLMLIVDVLKCESMWYIWYGWMLGVVGLMIFFRGREFIIGLLSYVKRYYGWFGLIILVE